MAAYAGAPRLSYPRYAPPLRCLDYSDIILYLQYVILCKVFLCTWFISKLSGLFLWKVKIINENIFLIYIWNFCLPGFEIASPFVYQYMLLNTSYNIKWIINFKSIRCRVAFVSNCHSISHMRKSLRNLKLNNL